MKKLLIISLAVLTVIGLASAVSYNHPSGSGTSEMDCFDDSGSICITRDLSGPPFNAGSGGQEAVRWGCGACGNVSIWFDEITPDLKSECIGGTMPQIIDTNICLDAGSAGFWDLDFHTFGSGGGGEFSYTRTSYELAQGAESPPDPRDNESEGQDAEPAPKEGRSLSIGNELIYLSVAAVVILLLAVLVLKKRK